LGWRNAAEGKIGCGPDLIKIGSDRIVLIGAPMNTSVCSLARYGPFASHQAPAIAHFNALPVATPPLKQASRY
jgi:hypothetical protein